MVDTIYSLNTHATLITLIKTGTARNCKTLLTVWYLSTSNPSGEMYTEAHFAA